MSSASLQEDCSDQEIVQDSLRINTSYSPNQQFMFYFPAGSLSSLRGSLEETDDELESQKENQTYFQTDDESSFIPSAENIISYEPHSPASPEKGPIVAQEEYQHKNFKFENTQPEETNYEEDLKKLLKLLKQATTENRELKAQLYEQPEVTDKCIGTEEDDEYYKVKKELKELKYDCEQYQAQNSQLRSEVQMTTNDLLELDSKFKQLNKQIAKSHQKRKTEEDQMKQLISLAESICGEETNSERQSRDVANMMNYLASQLEIIRSRFSRVKSKNEQLVLENSKLSKALERSKKTKANQDKNSAIQELTQKLKHKDRIIENLEHKLLRYKKTEIQRPNSDIACINANFKRVYESEEEPLRPYSTNGSEESGPTSYREVLKDLRQITTRATRALEHTRKVRPIQSNSPALVKPETERPHKSSLNFSTSKEYEELKKKYGNFLK